MASEQETSRRLSLDGTAETGPVYCVQLLGSLPMVNGTWMMQQMPSRADLEGILDHKSGTRVAAGYEIMLSHFRMTLDALIAAESFIDCHAADPDITSEMCDAYVKYQDAMKRLR